MFLKKLIPDSKIRSAVICGVLLVLTVLIEVFGFNYRHWQTLFNEEFTLPIEFGTSFEYNGDGTVTVVSSNDRSIYVGDINRRVNTVYVHFSLVGVDDKDNANAIKTDFNLHDDARYKLYWANERPICASEPRSSYVKLHTAGDIQEMMLYPYFEEGDSYKVEVSFNPVVPMFFAWERIALVFGLFMLIYWFRPGSILHRIKYLRIKPGLRYAIVAVFAVFTFLILLWSQGLNPYYQSEPQDNMQQYQSLAEALANGQFSLLYKPSEELINLPNPYDFELRDQTIGLSGYKFDHAYYNGNYYVYFGVVPVLLTYLPYYMVTGTHLHNHVACLIGLTLILVSLLLAMDEIIKKFYKDCSIGLWFMLTELFVLGSFIIYISKRPELYAVPITFAVGFGILGLRCFIKALPDNELGELDVKYIFWGALFTALITGCRPQVFLIFLLDIVILRKYIFNPKYLKTKNGIKAILCGVVPMLAVAAFMMYYNYSRFGSPFDFGAYYNLTFDDLRTRGWEWDRMQYGIYQFYLRPWETKPEYPYFGHFRDDSRYMGMITQEDMYGGIFFMAPFVLMGLFTILYRKYYSANNTTKSLRIMAYVAMAAGFTISVFDAVKVGFLGRYFCDFSHLLHFAAIFAVIGLMQSKAKRRTEFRRTLIIMLLCCIIFEVFFQITNFYQDAGDYLQGNRQDLYYHAYYLFEFTV